MINDKVQSWNLKNLLNYSQILALFLLLNTYFAVKNLVNGRNEMLKNKQKNEQKFHERQNNTINIQK